MKYRYVDKSDSTKSYSFIELQTKFRDNFNSYFEFSKWVDENFEEKCSYSGTPYERTRARVYATGNKWAIENFNATH